MKRPLIAVSTPALHALRTAIEPLPGLIADAWAAGAGVCALGALGVREGCGSLTDEVWARLVDIRLAKRDEREDCAFLTSAASDIQRLSDGAPVRIAHASADRRAHVLATIAAELAARGGGAS